MLKHTVPAPRPPECPPEKLAQMAAEISERVTRLNRMTYLAGQLAHAQLEGAIVLLEAACREQRALVGLQPQRAAEAIAYIMPDGVF